MQVKYDKETDILTIKLSDKYPVESEHLEDKDVILDFDDKDNIVGVEILNWSKKAKIEIPIVGKLTST